MKFVIDRNKWLRGKPGEGCLLNEEGKMCCLGFYSKALGIADEDMLDVAVPSDVRYDERVNYLEWLVYTSDGERFPTTIENNLAKVNDDKSTSDEFKEDSIKNIFGKFGVEVEFIGGEENGTKK